MNQRKIAATGRNFKNIFSGPLFTIIFRLEMLEFHTHSILTGDTMVGFVIFFVLIMFCLFFCTFAISKCQGENGLNTDHEKKKKTRLAIHEIQGFPGQCGFLVPSKPHFWKNHTNQTLIQYQNCNLGLLSSQSPLFCSFSLNTYF